jgi:hypothetical protein
MSEIKVANVVNVTARGQIADWAVFLAHLQTKQHILCNVDIAEHQFDLDQTTELSVVLAAAPNLTSLRLFNCRLTTDLFDPLLSVLPEMQTLQTLDIEYNLLDQPTFLALKKIMPVMHALYKVDVFANPGCHIGHMPFSADYNLKTHSWRRKFGRRLDEVWKIARATHGTTRFNAATKKHKFNRWFMQLHTEHRLANLTPAEFEVEAGLAHERRVEIFAARRRERDVNVAH